MYDPKDLLKLYLYGYMNRIRSSRRLEPESGRNLELIWLLRTLSPDHKTIAEFRRQNGETLKQIFTGFVKLCVKLGLYGSLSFPSVSLLLLYFPLIFMFTRWGKVHSPLFIPADCSR
jgi:hypothetical protein